VLITCCRPLHHMATGSAIMAGAAVAGVSFYGRATNRGCVHVQPETVVTIGAPCERSVSRTWAQGTQPSVLTAWLLALPSWLCHHGWCLCDLRLTLWGWQPAGGATARTQRAACPSAICAICAADMVRLGAT
jgi:hypothetical protein